MTAAILREVARKSGVPLQVGVTILGAYPVGINKPPVLPPPQEVAVRNDGACGTTIGPIVAARLGLRTVGELEGTGGGGGGGTLNL